MLAQAFLIEAAENEDIMAIALIKSRWNEVKERLKQQYNMLSDDDLALTFGHEGDLIGRLQRKLGKTKADILRIIAEA